MQKYDNAYLSYANFFFWYTFCLHLNMFILELSILSPCLHSFAFKSNQVVSLHKWLLQGMQKLEWTSLCHHQHLGSTSWDLLWEYQRSSRASVYNSCKFLLQDACCWWNNSFVNIMLEIANATSSWRLWGERTSETTCLRMSFSDNWLNATTFQNLHTRESEDWVYICRL